MPIMDSWNRILPEKVNHRGLNFWVKGDGSKKQLNNKKGIQDFHYIMVFFYWKIHQEICFAVAFKVNE